MSIILHEMFPRSQSGHLAEHQFSAGINYELYSNFLLRVTTPSLDFSKVDKQVKEQVLEPQAVLFSAGY